jgi:hypothetical protein
VFSHPQKDEVSASTVTDMVERRTSLVLQAASMSAQGQSALTSEEPRREREFNIIHIRAQSAGTAFMDAPGASHTPSLC